MLLHEEFDEKQREARLPDTLRRIIEYSAPDSPTLPKLLRELALLLETHDNNNCESKEEALALWMRLIDLQVSCTHLSQKALLVHPCRCHS